MTENKINDGGPAFPQTIDDMGTLRSMTEGLTKREWFAGMALQGLLAHSCDQSKNLIGEKAPSVASRAYEMAEAMISEGKKGRE